MLEKYKGHLSDCSTNNHGSPELLGPCDCGFVKSQRKWSSSLNHRVHILASHLRMLFRSPKVYVHDAACASNGSAASCGCWRVRFISVVPEKLTQQQIAAVESARHELVTLGGLLAADGVSPSETFTIDVDAVIKQLDEAFSPLFENDTMNS